MRRKVKRWSVLIFSGILSFLLTSCGNWTRRTSNCVPEVSLTSSEAVAFLLVRPNEGDPDLAKYSIYSKLKRGDDEYFLEMFIPKRTTVNDRRETLSLRGHASEALPIGTELQLDGTAARTTPIGLDRAFDITSVDYLRGEVDGYKVWLATVYLPSLGDLAKGSSRF